MIIKLMNHIRKNVVVHNKCFYSGWVQPNGNVTDIKVYNTVTRSVVPLILPKNVLSWYMCGPTVYSDAHIGHAFCYVKFDIIRRIMENFFQINVIQVMGITDIDDKIINRANEANKGFRELAVKYEQDFIKDMKDLNVKAPTITARVSDNVHHIIKFIEKLLEKKFAYVAVDGSVYFDVSTYGEKYGRLVPYDEQQTYDIQPNTTVVKKNRADFALWKAVKPQEPWWDSPWGKGRPGWHIECSAIASNIFGKTLDIHSGGIDLLFPHHENEIAQSEAYHSVDQWVNYWLHSGHLHLNQEKMSKSLQNTISIQEFLKSHSADVFRTFCLLSHYRNSVEFTDTTLEVASSTYNKFESFSDTVRLYLQGYLIGSDISESELTEKLENCKLAVSNALRNDFDTHEAIINILSLVNYTNTLIYKTKEKISETRSPAMIAYVGNFVEKVMENFGIVKSAGVKGVDVSSELENVITSVVKFRKEVRQVLLKGNSQNERSELLNACDQLRNSLSESGIKIKDHGVESSWNIERKK